MKRIFRNVLCIMLAVLVLAGSCVSLAAAAKDYSGYKVYVCLGDSIPAGIGETNSTEKFLYRSAGSPEVRSDVSFTDVAADSYCADAAAWAAVNGISKGYSDGSFHPDAVCTRAQAVTFIFRFAA